MHIQYNKVTWYSKLLALILFVALPFAGFELGVKYQKMRDAGYEGRRIISELKTDTSTSPSINNSKLIADTSTWKTYRNDTYGFQVKYPKDWFIQFDNPTVLASKPKEENAHGVGRPQGGSWISVSKNDSCEATNVFRSEIKPKYWEKWSCRDGFLIATGYWPIDSKKSPEDETLLDSILSTFQFIEPQAQVSTSTATWKTYRNEEYGFELKIPQDWEISGPIIGGEIHFVSPQQSKLNKEYQAKYCTGIGSDRKCTAAWLPYDFVLELDSLVADENGVSVRETNNAVFKVYSSPERKVYLNYKSNYETDRYGKIFNFTFTRVVSDQQIFAILSTFKFIEPQAKIDTSTWKTYRNDKYGFEFKYPSTWKVAEIPEGVVLEVSPPSTQYFEDNIGKGVFFQIEVRGRPGYPRSYGLANPNALSIQQWFKENMLGGEIIESDMKAFEISDRSAIRIRSAEVGGPWTHIYVPSGTEVFEIAFGRDEGTPYYETVLSTFKFTK